MKRCPMCRAMFSPRRIDQTYCSTGCSKKADQLELARARRLYRALYHWRLDRSKKGVKQAGQLLVFICREIRHWIEEDRLNQQGPPAMHDLMADRGHQRVKAKAGLGL